MAKLIKRTPRRILVSVKEVAGWPGWRQLGDNETIRKGDKYWSEPLYTWMSCESSIGDTPKDWQFIVKRIIATKWRS